MKGMVPPDPAGGVSKEHYAVVYVPRKNRSRFPAASVTVVDDRDTALAQANPSQKRFAAIVQGPSKSSEGQFIYYLINWLE